jgi:hypothetical protein
MAVVVAALATGACRDSPTDVLAGIVTPETQPALALGVVLPDPSAWAEPATDGTADGTAGAAALAAWRSSWDLPAASGREVREASYDALIGLLPPDRREATAAEDLTTLQRALQGAEALPAEALPPTVRRGLATAQAEATAAAVARDGHDVTGALVHVLRGADALREVGPEAVARTLVDDVEKGMRRIGPGAAYSPTDIERMRRLVQGGREALEQGNWVLAIRRAYYARALMTSRE